MAKSITKGRTEKKSGIIDSLLPLAVPIDSIKPDPRNARTHPARNMKAITDSLRAYGQRKPVVVNRDTGFIEAGNGLWQAAKSLGWATIAAVFVNDHESVAKAYGLMDNQSALLAEWDLPVLKDLLQELDDGETDMDLTGFDEKEIEELLCQIHQPEGNKKKIVCPKCGYEFSLNGGNAE